MSPQLTLWKRFNRIVFLTFWFTGLLLIWQIVPPGDRDGWQIPADEFIVGFLHDGSTLVTVPRTKTGNRKVGTKESGPIRLWDINTGQLLAEHFDKAYLFERVTVDPPGRLKIQEEVKDTPEELRLRLLDALTARELQVFTSRVPLKNIWWIISSNGRFSAFQSFEGEKPHIELHDNQSGKMIKRLGGWRESIRFSRDGSLLCAQDENRQDIGIFSIPEGDLLVRIKPLNNSQNPNSPSAHSFSADNTLLVDSACNVWEVKTGKLRFSVPNIYYNSIAFTPDSRYLAVVARNTSACWIAWYDTTTGEEDVPRRTSLVEGRQLHMHLSGWNGNPESNKKYFVSSGTPSFEEAPQWKKWLAKIPGLESLGQQTIRDAYVIVDCTTAKEVCRGPFQSVWMSPDGETMARSARDNRYELCDIPPRKPWKRYLLLYAGVSLLLFVPIVVRRWRERRIAHALART